MRWVGGGEWQADATANTRSGAADFRFSPAAGLG